MNWYFKSFEQLSNKELYKILQLRAAVFIVEQTCAYQDIDDKDFKAQHQWAEDAAGNIVAYCRLLPENISYKEPSIGRVATSMGIRKSGAGREMMEQAIKYIGRAFGSDSIRISAQLYLKSFYESLGFRQVGESYPEDDIPHIEMLLEGADRQ